MKLDEFLVEAKNFIADTGLESGLQRCGVPEIALLQTRFVKTKSCAIMEPVIGLILQGRKTATYGHQIVNYSAGDIVIVGQSLPIVSGRIDVDPDLPFIAVYVGLDMHVLRSVYSDMGGSSRDAPGPAFSVGPAEADVVDAIARLFRLHRDPVEQQALGAAALREVYFRVLQSSRGNTLRQLIHADSKANQIARAIAHIRLEYRNTIKASELADIAGMSASVFYETFKQITANSPLQYQKDLRLLEAHRMLLQASQPIAEVAHSVGYESPAQFSREFSRKFGTSPRALAGSVPA